MSKRPKGSLPLDSPNWLPIHGVVGAICQATDNRRLAARDLTAAMAEDDGVPSMWRCVDYGQRSNGEGVLLGPDRQLLSPRFWTKHELDAWSDRTFVRCRGCDGKHQDTRYFQFYAWKPGLEKIWPVIFVPTLRPTPAQTGNTQPPARRRGPVLKYDWHAIDGEIARRCIDPKSGRVQVPKNESKVADDVLNWLAESGKNGPAVSDMRDAVKIICAALRSAQK